MFVALQFFPFGGTGKGSQLNRNVGKNAFPVRDIAMHVDDWVFFLDDSLEETAQKRIESFRASTEIHWRADGSAESSWMTTGTIHDHSEEDRFMDYFPSKAWYHRLQGVKNDVDPKNLFSSAMTIPPTTR